MSTGGKTDITCECGCQFTAWLWQSVSVSREPELLETILGGSMNVVTCPCCSSRFHVEVPFLYHDMHAKEWIWVYPLSFDKRSDEVHAKVEAMWRDLVTGMPPGVKEIYQKQYRVLVLFGMDALVHYLRSNLGGNGDESGPDQS